MNMRIRVVDIEDLRQVLGYSMSTVTPTANLYTPYSRFQMQRHDAPVLRYLLQNHRPKRHLEFGTWEGFGVVLCANTSDAHIWTINLPDGEFDEATGKAQYRQAASEGSTEERQTDCGSAIGRLYREANLQSRVTQILSDSREWRHDSFENGFFDSVFIDGGHTPPVVKNDTDIAIRLLRKGGLCLWHDFCPSPDAIDVMPATRGVVQAVVDNFETWAGFFSQIFWIRHTFILAGVRA